MADRPTDPLHASSSALGPRAILGFLLPLALTSQLVALTGPLVNAPLAKAGAGAAPIAAFWVAFTVVLFLESASLVVQSVWLACATRAADRRRVLAFAVAAGVAGGAAALALARTGPGAALLAVAVPSTPRVLALAREALAVLSVLPLLVAIRGLASAEAIRRRRTPLVAVATAVRLLALGTAGAVLGRAVSPAVAAAALVVAVAAETAVLALALGRLREAEAAAADPGGVVRVAMPLVAGMLAWTASRPLVQGALGRLAEPEGAQAAFGVVLPLLFFACSPLWSLQEAVLVLPRSGRQLRALGAFAAGAAALVSAALAALAVTPLGASVVGGLLGAPGAVHDAARDALPMLVVVPPVLAARAFAHGVLLRARRTGVVLAAAPLRLVVIALGGALLARVAPDANGAAAGVALMALGEAADLLVAASAARGVLARGEAFAPPAAIAVESAETTVARQAA